jgi:hypothetical protein
MALGIWACSDYAGRDVFPSSNNEHLQLASLGDTSRPLTLMDFSQLGTLTVLATPLYAPDALSLGYASHSWIPNNSALGNPYTEIYSSLDPLNPPSPGHPSLSEWTGTLVSTKNTDVDGNVVYVLSCSGKAYNCKWATVTVEGVTHTVLVVKV